MPTSGTQCKRGRGSWTNGWDEVCETMGYVSWFLKLVPSGERLHSYGKSPFFMGKSTISMAMFNSFLYVHQRVTRSPEGCHDSQML